MTRLQTERAILISACLIGLACACVAQLAGCLAIIAIVATLIATLVTSRGSSVGIATLGLACLYGLAAVTPLHGSDPEEVSIANAFELAVVAFGCALVGVTSLAVIVANARRRLCAPEA